MQSDATTDAREENSHTSCCLVIALFIYSVVINQMHKYFSFQKIIDLEIPNLASKKTLKIGKGVHDTLQKNLNLYNVLHIMWE